MKAAIAYVRVSTDKQGKSGLGLEAQQAAIANFCMTNGFELIETVVEVETGKGDDALKTRPQFASVIEIARLTGATIVAAKLDRITRNVHFGSGLFGRNDISFRIADMPHADNFQINIMLSVAQLERDMISKRTKDALAAAKARGQQLGRRGQDVAANTFADNLRAVLEPIRHLSSRAIAATLNAQGVLTATGGAWSSVTVLRTLARLELAQ
jgi:DNA invertase Pin-like site-specific DNA recombinase